MRIGIIGGGVVGQATARTYLEHVDEVFVYDTMKQRSTHPFDYVIDYSDIIFICVPEAHVEDIFSPYALKGRMDCNFVLKSTVPIGTTRRLSEKYSLANLTHSPEFLTARCAVTDAQLPSRNIIGTPNGLFRDSLLQRVYKERFPAVPILHMTSDESEAVKLILNGFFAAKVSYFNEVNAMCHRLGLSWDHITKGVLSDGRVAHSHTKVPGPDGNYGFGGACLPKDLLQLITCIEDSGVSAPLCRAALERNKIDRERK